MLLVVFEHQSQGSLVQVNVNPVWCFQEEKSTATYLDLLKTPAIRFIAIVLFYNWYE